MTRSWLQDSVPADGRAARREWSRREEAARTRVQEILDESGLFGDERATSVIFGVLPRPGTYFIDHLLGTAQTTFRRDDIPSDLAHRLLAPIQEAKWLGELEWEFGDDGPTYYRLYLEKQAEAHPAELESSGLTADAEPDSEHDAIRIELYRDHGHSGTNDGPSVDIAQCRTCDRLSERLATALHEFQESLR